jgi:spastin
MNINRNMYNPNQGNNIRNNNQPKRDNNMFQHNINNDNNLFRSMNNLSMKKWQQTNQNQRLPPSNQQPQQQQPKKKGLHDKEDDEMDAKIESEIMSSNPGVKFSDIVGMKDLKQIIYEIIIMPNVRPDLFTGLRQPQRGLLLFGPPGTGKTMIAKAIASECESTFFNISASSLTSKWVGESEKTVRSLFKLAYAKQPSIIFIDEIDSVLSKRSDNDNEAAKRLKTEFLIQFDGLGSNSSAKLLVIAATNRPMDLDDALLRRLPKRVYCGPLDEEGRFSYIKKLLESVEYDIKDEDIMKISKKTDGYSNSDLLEICREAAYEPVREKTTEEILQLHKFRPLVISDFEKALTKIRGSISAQVMKEMDKWNKTYGAI